jgi:type I restriction enzyme S subunit
MNKKEKKLKKRLMQNQPSHGIGHKEFKDTKIGNIPREWGIKRIIDLFEVKTGTTPPTKTNNYWEDGTINWYTPADMNKLNGKLEIEKSERKITKEGFSKSNLNLIPPNSIIISTRAPVGYVIIPTEKATFNQGCKGLVPKTQTETNQKYYAYYLQSKKEDLENRSSGSTFKELGKFILENFKIPFPPLPEQKKIAEILTTLDEAIEKVDGAIQKAERLKKGLMQKLMSRNKKLWEYVTVKEISHDLLGGGTPSTSQTSYWNGKIAWMTSAHISNREITFGQKYISEEGLKNSATKLIPKNNILVATRVGIGKIAINKIEIAISQDLTGILVKGEKILSDYLYWFLLTKKNRLKALAQGSTIKGILKDDLAKLKLSLPPLSEQKKIAEILSTADQKLELMRERKCKLNRVKKGLMNDLLSGKRRVKL